MYDHLPPRLAKYLAQIYTGTDVPEIEQGISTRDLAEAAKAYAETWVQHQRIMRWNKQRGQKINQLNQRIHEQRLKIRELCERVEDMHWGKARYKALTWHWYRECWRVNKWNDAHKREIAQLQSKLHDRRVEVKRQQEEIDFLSEVIRRKQARMVALQNELLAEREAMKKLVAELNRRDEKIVSLEKECRSKSRSNDALASLLYDLDKDWEFK